MCPFLSTRQASWMPPSSCSCLSSARCRHPVWSPECALRRRGEDGAVHEGVGVSGSTGQSLPGSKSSQCCNLVVWVLSCPSHQESGQHRCERFLCAHSFSKCVQLQPCARQHLSTCSSPVSSPPLNQSPCSHSRSILITAPVRAFLALGGEVLTPSNGTIPGPHCSRAPVPTHNLPPPPPPTLRD